MLGGFKWHSNAGRGCGGGAGGSGGRPPDPGLPRVPLHCRRDTQKPSHTRSPSPSSHGLLLLLELQDGDLVFGLELDLDTHFIFVTSP